MTKSLKENSINKRMVELKELESSEITEFAIKEIDVIRFKLMNNIELNRELDEFKVFTTKDFMITEIKYSKYSTKGKVYQLKSGKTIDVKFKKTSVSGEKISEYDHIYIDNIKLENRWYVTEDKEWKKYTDEDNKKEYVVYNFIIRDKNKEKEISKGSNENIEEENE